ncbi:DUF790 family protein [Lentisphaera marina]|uniref:DUF790 family protein n=1 Tax=Lentisphaera marina TaxID=1111041 RepID=UPI0023671DC3|nr:DUF790 family protein [Lentisphaera marina]MDD7985494.1 DUF790 family protein [Lentisphaera marina]
MLTKDLVKFSRRKDRIYPHSIKTDQQALLDLAQDLVTIYAHGEGKNRQELEEESSILINSFSTPLIARGLNRLCLDRCEFTQCLEVDFASAREQIFDLSAQHLKEANKYDFDGFREHLERQVPNDLQALVHEDLYGDLPHSDLLLKFKSLRPVDLLHRYNLAQVQYHMLFAGDLSLNLKKVEAADLRKIFKYLKFFRLLARIESKTKGALKITIDGPLSLFENTRKYGLQLANFIPAFVDCANWQFEAKIDLPRFKNKVLKLSHKEGLKSHYKNFSAYVPEEIRLFHKSFADKAKDWQIVGDTPFVEMGEEGKQEIIFPDLSFAKDAKRVHMELFHRWHAGALRRRLDQLHTKPDCQLLIGIDRSLVRSSSFKEEVESHPYFEKHGFLFNDFPSVTKVNSLLKGF